MGWACSWDGSMGDGGDVALMGGEAKARRGACWLPRMAARPAPTRPLVGRAPKRLVRMFVTLRLEIEFVWLQEAAYVGRYYWRIKRDMVPG